MRRQQYSLTLLPEGICEDMAKCFCCMQGDCPMQLSALVTAKELGRP